jgi:hypothetical protein
MTDRQIENKIFCATIVTLLLLGSPTAACASDIGADIAGQIALVVGIGMTLVLAAITIAIVHVSTKNKRAWLYYPVAALAWFALLSLLSFVFW